MRISDWSSDVCSSDLLHQAAHLVEAAGQQLGIGGAWGRQLQPRMAGRHQRLAVVEQLLVQLLAGTQASEANLDLLVGLQTGEADDLARQLDDPHRLAHVEHVDPPGLSSEEHTSELQSLMRISYAVFCLKKKK